MLNIQSGICNKAQVAALASCLSQHLTFTHNERNEDKLPQVMNEILLHWWQQREMQEGVKLVRCMG